MLGVFTEILNEVAQMPTPHSWAAKIMSLPTEKLDEETEKVDKWIQQTMEKEFPKSGLAERIVRETWPAVMEREAIEKFLEKRPGFAGILIPMEPWEASEIGGMDVIASPEEKEVAQQFLEEMLEGKRVPPLEYLFVKKRKMEKKEAILWGVTIKMAKQGNQSAKDNLDSENQWRKENNLPSVEEELSQISCEINKSDDGH